MSPISVTTTATFFQDETYPHDPNFVPSKSEYATKKCSQRATEAEGSNPAHSSVKTEPLNLQAKLHKSDDPFLYYSNEEIRMKTLLLEEVSETATIDDQTEAQRKTRISFEVHPSMFLDDISNIR
mmetsp:Transcript_1518/g.2962  ORF Transcript_1518/g.2962 Transcript_1518/m.2962 type:complete len:125 (+) Transcript_1518:98-472(+)